MEEAHDFARECKAEVCKETSAKDNVGVSELFAEIGLKLYKKHKAKVNKIYIKLFNLSSLREYGY